MDMKGVVLRDDAHANEILLQLCQKVGNFIAKAPLDPLHHSLVKADVRSPVKTACQYF